MRMRTSRSYSEGKRHDMSNKLLNPEAPPLADITTCIVPVPDSSTAQPEAKP